MGLPTLKEYLSNWTLDGRTRGQVAETVLALAAASAGLSELIGRGALANKLGRVVARAGEIDEQKEIDVLANNIIVEELKALPVAALASEESEFPIAIQNDAPLLVATDPLDGSSNVDANVCRNDLFYPAASPVVRWRGGISSAGFPSARRGLLRVWPTNGSGSHGRPRYSDFHAR